MSGWKILAFLSVVMMGCVLRFGPSSNWVWWADLIWIVVVSFGAVMLSSIRPANDR